MLRGHVAGGENIDVSDTFVNHPGQQNIVFFQKTVLQERKYNSTFGGSCTRGFWDLIPQTDDFVLCAIASMRPVPKPLFGMSAELDVYTVPTGIMLVIRCPQDQEWISYVQCKSRNRGNPRQ